MALPALVALLQEPACPQGSVHAAGATARLACDATVRGQVAAAALPALAQALQGPANPGLRLNAAAAFANWRTMPPCGSLWQTRPRQRWRKPCETRRAGAMQPLLSTAWQLSRASGRLLQMQPCQHWSASCKTLLRQGARPKQQDVSLSLQLKPICSLSWQDQPCLDCLGFCRPPPAQNAQHMLHECLHIWHVTVPLSIIFLTQHCQPSLASWVHKTHLMTSAILRGSALSWPSAAWQPSPSIGQSLPKQLCQHWST